MKCLIVFVAVLAVSSAQFGFSGRSPSYSRPAAPSQSTNDRDASVVRYDNEVNPDGSYRYSYATSNGIQADEQGTPRSQGGKSEDAPVVAQGSYAYTSPEGVPVAISYVADENGYQPTGDSLPVGPPVPPAILRALEWIARNPEPQRRN